MITWPWRRKMATGLLYRTSTGEGDRWRQIRESVVVRDATDFPPQSRRSRFNPKGLSSSFWEAPTKTLFNSRNTCNLSKSISFLLKLFHGCGEALKKPFRTGFSASRSGWTEAKTQASTARYAITPGILCALQRTPSWWSPIFNLYTGGHRSSGWDLFTIHQLRVATT